jgi:hypothetical protein
MSPTVRLDAALLTLAALWSGGGGDTSEVSVDVVGRSVATCSAERADEYTCTSEIK